MRIEKRPVTHILPALCLALCLLLSACGGKGMQPEPDSQPAQSTEPAAAPAPAETSPALPAEAQQREILEANRSLWEFADPYESPWYYAFTDLDHNGLLEVLARSTQGSGIFTYVHYYEVRADGSGIENLYHKNAETEGPDDWPEIVHDSLDCYYDEAHGRYWYPCEGVTRSVAAHQYFAWYALCLKDGEADWELLAAKNVEYENGWETVACADANGGAISAADYDSAVERRFAGMARSVQALDWTEVNIPWPEEAAATPVPVGPAVVITKNPTSEALSVGGKTWFIAHAQNADRLTWQLTDPTGRVHSLQSAMELHPGLQLEALEGDTLAVSNVPASVNGWGVQALFEGPGGTAVTVPAILYVGNFIEAYDSVISAYRDAYSSGQINAGYLIGNGLSEVAAYSNGVGFALKDLDKNGVPELIIAGMDTDDFSEGMANDIYTLVGGRPVNVVTSGARNRYYLLTDNRVLNEGSGGAAHTFISTWRLRGDVLEFEEAVFTDLGADNQLVFYGQQGGPFEYQANDRCAVISREAFDGTWEAWKAKVFVPPLTRIF